jgi:hypothetical protein
MPYLRTHFRDAAPNAEQHYDFWIVTSEEELSRDDARSLGCRMLDIVTHRYSHFDWSTKNSAASRVGWNRSPISWANYPISFYPPGRVFP